MARCSSCGAPIRWTRSVKGKPMPLDLEMVLGGEVSVDRNLISRVVKPEAEVYRYRAHWATCPQAASHRSKVRT